MKKGHKVLIGYLNDVVRPLTLMRLKMSGYVKTLYDNELIYFRIDNEKLSETYESIWIKVEELKGIGLTALPVHHENYFKT